MIYIQGWRTPWLTHLQWLDFIIYTYNQTQVHMIRTHYSNMTMHHFYQAALLLVCTYLGVRVMRTMLYTLSCRARLSRIRGPTSTSWLKGNYFDLVSSIRKVIWLTWICRTHAPVVWSETWSSIPQRSCRKIWQNCQSRRIPRRMFAYCLQMLVSWSHKQDKQLYISDPLALSTIIVKDQEIFEETRVFIEYV